MQIGEAMYRAEDVYSLAARSFSSLETVCTRRRPADDESDFAEEAADKQQEARARMIEPRESRNMPIDTGTNWVDAEDGDDGR